MLLTVVLDAPESHLFLEVLLSIGSLELGVHFPLVPQVVDERKERLSISIDEVRIVHLLQLVHPGEHPAQLRLGERSQHLQRDHDLVSSADVELNDVSVEAVLLDQDALLMLPVSLGVHDLVQLGLQLLLGVVVLVADLEVVVLNGLVVGSEFNELL